MKTIVCTACFKEKALSEFRPYSDRPSLRRKQCLPCEQWISRKNEFLKLIEDPIKLENHFKWLAICLKSIKRDAEKHRRKCLEAKYEAKYAEQLAEARRVIYNKAEAKARKKRMQDVVYAEKRKEKQRAWDQNRDKEKNRKRCRKYHEANKDKMNIRSQQYYLKNREKARIDNRNFNRKQLKELSDRYVKARLRDNGITFVNPEIIKVKRELLKITRLIRRHERNRSF